MDFSNWRFTAGLLLVLSAALTLTACSAIATQLSWQLQEKQAEARESLEISKMDAKPRVNAEE